MNERMKAIVSWSSGKDSALALQRIREADELEIVAVLTSITDTFGRVSMHGVREELLDRQVEELGLRCIKVRIPFPCPNEVYDREMAGALESARTEGVEHVVFGDIFLSDVRAYREERLQNLGMKGVFPLWRADTTRLSRQLIEEGFHATLTCVNPAQLARTFVGQRYDRTLLDKLPRLVDPCGENGEFHTVVTAGPMFKNAIETELGEVTERDGFVFADVLPRTAA